MCKKKGCIKKAKEMGTYTWYECKECGARKIWKSKMTPKICPQCAVKDKKCQFCKGKL